VGVCECMCGCVWACVCGCVWVCVWGRGVHAGTFCARTHMHESTAVWLAQYRLFGVVGGRFRILRTRIRVHHLDVAGDVFVSCVVLHNMVLSWRAKLAWAQRLDYDLDNAKEFPADVVGEFEPYEADEIEDMAIKNAHQLERIGQRLVQPPTSQEHWQRLYGVRSSCVCVFVVGVWNVGLVLWFTRCNVAVVVCAEVYL
jgi:hypothetical protein